MECDERTRLAQEYFRALDQHQKIAAALQQLVDSGKTELIKVGETQAEAAIQEAYEAWHALNEHQHVHQCGA